MKKWCYYIMPVALYVFIVRHSNLAPIDENYFMVDNEILIRRKTLK